MNHNKLFTGAIILLLLCLFSRFSSAQQCGNCKTTPSVAQYDLDVQVMKPALNGNDSTGWLEWRQLFWLGKHANPALLQNNKTCIRFTQPASSEVSDESFVTKDGIEVPSLIEESEQLKVGLTYTNLPPSGNLSKYGNYLITGNVKASGGGYVMHIELQASCNRKVVTSADVPFNLSSESSYILGIANQAAAKLSPLIDKIKQFELRERRENKKVALEGGTGEAITIKPKKRNLAGGEQTEIEITMKDCDGEPLGNREIVFTKGTLNGMLISSGTIGGTVNPAKVFTDVGGKAKANFKMGSNKSAIINAYHIYDKPYGCPDVKLGSIPIGSIPIKVEVIYFQNEIHTIKRATLPGVKIIGGKETEQYLIAHHSILYHYPSASQLKQGMLVAAINDNPPKDARTEYILESGYYDFTKTEETAYVMGMVGDKPFVAGTEEGSQKKIEGSASIDHHSQIMFFKGDGNNPAQFSWNVEYPSNANGDIGSAGINITKGDEGVEWVVNKITDPNSPYKTEYILNQKLDAAEELAKGNKAMKQLFGFDLGGLTKVIDPTNPQENIAVQNGSQTIMVRILSPYPAD